MDITTKQALISLVKEGNLSALESLSEVDKNNHILMGELCKINKLCILYASQKLQSDATFTVQVAQGDFDFAFWVCLNSTDTVDNKIKIAKAIASEPVNFSDIPSRLFEDKRFIDICTELAFLRLSHEEPSLKISIKGLIDQKTELARIERDLGKKSPAVTFATEQAEPAKETVEISDNDKVTEMLLEMGVPTHVKGFKYIRDSVVLALSDEEALERVTKILYPVVAKQNKTTPSRVERAIRHTVELMANDPDKSREANERLSFEFFKGYNKPTNSEFLSFLTETYQLEQRREIHTPTTEKAFGRG